MKTKRLIAGLVWAVLARSGVSLAQDAAPDSLASSLLTVSNAQNRAASFYRACRGSP